MQKAILYYDGQCPLCRGEIARLDRLSDAALETIDVHTLDAAPAIMETRLRTLHLETENGSVLTGLDANVHAWRYTRFGFLLGWLRWPLIGRVADVVYGAWARRRFRRLYPLGYAAYRARTPG